MSPTVLDEIISKLDGLPKSTLEKLARTAYAATGDKKFVPNPGPQTEAYFSEADELFFGGGSGGGKSELLLGLSINEHRRSLLLRRLNTEVSGLYDRLEEILGTKKGFSQSPKPIWRMPGRIIMFGGCQHLNDRVRYQGVPKDLIGVDEAPNFLEDQYTFIINWARSTVPGQRVRVVATGNPPTTPEGMWVNKRWGAWLDPKHPNPALPGELRWYTTIDDVDTEVDGSGPVVIDGVPLLDHRGKPILPKSRTFIPADLSDNPDLEETGYGATLANLPGVLRRSMMEGDFTAGMDDDAWQVFPSEWIEEAMTRWNPAGISAPMTVLGVDIAQAGPDKTVLAPRHGSWFDHLKVYPGKDTPDGPTVAGLVLMNMRNDCEVILDMGGGYGISTRDHLRQSFSPTLFNGSSAADGMRDKAGVFKFANLRAAATWYLREALDPTHGAFIALPPDSELKSDLCSLRWKHLSGGKILIESKDDVKKRIGRSPDRGDAVIMAHFARGKTSSLNSARGSLQARATTSGRNPRRH